MVTRANSASVGGAYMAVCGMSDHAAQMVRMAIHVVHITRGQAMGYKVAMRLRVGHQ